MGAYFDPNIHVTKEPMQKFKTLHQPILRFYERQSQQEQKRKDLPKIVATFVCACSQGQRMPLDRTKKYFLL